MGEQYSTSDEDTEQRAIWHIPELLIRQMVEQYFSIKYKKLLAHFPTARIDICYSTEQPDKDYFDRLTRISIYKRRDVQ